MFLVPLAGSVPAAAAVSAPQRATVLRVDAAGATTPAMKERLDEAARRGFGGEVDHPEAACAVRDTECLEALDDAPGTRLLVTEVTVAEPDSVVEMALVADGEVLATTRSICELCGQDELTARVSNLAGTMRVAFDREQSMGRVAITSSPAGARVFIDGSPVGVTPLDGYLIEPGPHDIRVQAEGMTPDTRTVEAAAGSTLRLTSALQPLPVEDGPLRSGRGLRIAGWISLGAGLAAIGTGAGLLAIDGREHRSSCRDALQDADGDCPNVWTTRGSGIAAVVVGSLALGAGVGLVTVGYRRARNRGHATVGARARAGGLDVVMRF